VYPWHDSIFRYFREFKGYEGESAREFWKYFHSLTYDEQMYYVSIPLNYLDTTPKEDVLTYLPLIAELGTVYYITHRSKELIPATRKFFNNFSLPFKENVIFTSDKPTYMRLLNIDFFLDDRWQNIEEVKGITEAFLFKAAYNWEYREKYNMIYSFKEFYEMLKERSGN
jgi:uncharacterized HAD superfamily protein